MSKQPKRRILVRTTSTVETRNRNWTRWMAVGTGAAVGGAIILWVWGKPGDLPISIVTGAVEDMAEEAGIKGRDAGPEPVTPQTLAAKLYRQVRSNETAQAVATLEQLVELDEKVALEKKNTILDLAERAFTRRDPVKERMAKLMTEGMGSDGPDLLFDLMVTRKNDEAARLLSEAEVVGRGSKDMQLAYAIHVADPCRKKALVLAAEREGGDRVVREIRALTEPCQPGARCCLQDDRAIAGVAERIEKR